MTPDPQAPDGRVWAVLVTYNPDLPTLQGLVAALLGQVEQVMLIDNGSANAAALAAACRDTPRLSCQYLAENAGIAHAQNLGWRAAAQGGADYVIFFDQDSAVPATLVDALHAAFVSLAATQRLAATAPVFQDVRHGFFYPLIALGRWGLRRRIVPDGTETAPFPISMAISSGTFTSVAALHAIGPLRDDFFIDYVDTEWCLRAGSLGYALYAVPAARMLHSIGDRSVRFFKWRLVSHAPFRRYYRVRNGFFMLRLHHVPLLLGLREITINSAMQLIFMLTGSSKLANLKAYLAGVRDGLGPFQGHRW